VTDRVRADLGGVPETALWTLFQRAAEASRPDAVLDDPLAVELVARIDHPFGERFGPPRLAQWQALRARCFDRAVRRFLDAHPGATVVALGEGLETQFWRVDDGRVTWIGVDGAEIVALRERLLPASPRLRAVSGSALDLACADAVPDGAEVLVTAQGLLMYLEPAQVHGLIVGLARRFSGGRLVFDAVPAWSAALSRRGWLVAGDGYRPPPWPWGMDAQEERRIAGLPGVASLTGLRLPRGRGPVFGAALPLLARMGWARRRMLTVFEAVFA
jgi:O-methyltransferase involved in polyketide biosynthesis